MLALSLQLIFSWPGSNGNWEKLRQHSIRDELRAKTGDEVAGGGEKLGLRTPALPASTSTLLTTSAFTNAVCKTSIVPSQPDLPYVRVPPKLDDIYSPSPLDPSSPMSNQSIRVIFFHHLDQQSPVQLRHAFSSIARPRQYGFCGTAGCSL